MSARPTWYRKLPEIVEALQKWQGLVDRSSLESLLDVTPRRAQQILAPCATGRVGSSIVARPEAVIRHLQEMVSEESAYYENRRRLKLAEALRAWETEVRARPKYAATEVAVVAPAAFSQEFEDLPEGIEIEPGRVVLTFDEPTEALQKLFALAMAISNDLPYFERLTTKVATA